MIFYSKCRIFYQEVVVDYFTRFYLQTNQVIRNLMSVRATALAGTDPDYATRDLYNAIALGQFPTWTFYRVFGK
jgi:catalase